MLATGELTNLTKDTFADFAPTFAPDGKSIVYTARISSNDKLFQLDLATGAEEAADVRHARRHGREVLQRQHDRLHVDGDRPDAVDLAGSRAQRQHPERLDARPADGRAAAADRHDERQRLAGPAARRPGRCASRSCRTTRARTRIHTITADRPIATVATGRLRRRRVRSSTSRRRSSHTLVPRQHPQEGHVRERMTLAGRPPVGLGVTSGGNFYGNTEITFTDLLGDKQFSFFAQSVSQYRTIGVLVPRTSRTRLQYALQGFSQDSFYYGAERRRSTIRTLAPYIDRDLAESAQSQRGGTAFGHLSVQPVHARRAVRRLHAPERAATTTRPCSSLPTSTRPTTTATPIFRNGHMLPFGVSLVQETTVFREFGPVAGNTFKDHVRRLTGARRQLALAHARSTSTSATTQRLGANGVFAAAVQGLQELGPQSGLPVLRRQLGDARVRLPRSSSARRRSSPTSSCASRSSTRC